MSLWVEITPFIRQLLPMAMRRFHTNRDRPFVKCLAAIVHAAKSCFAPCSVPKRHQMFLWRQCNGYLILLCVATRGASALLVVQNARTVGTTKRFTFQVLYMCWRRLKLYDKQPYDSGIVRSRVHLRRRLIPSLLHWHSDRWHFYHCR